jgi:hypothetical protein
MRPDALARRTRRASFDALNKTRAVAEISELLQMSYGGGTVIARGGPPRVRVWDPNTIRRRSMSTRRAQMG